MKFRILILFFLTVSSFEMYATHAAGMDISYQCLSRGSSSDTYKIIVKFYRDCDGVRAPPTVTLDYQSSCSNSSVNLSLTGSPVILNAQCSNLCNGGSVIGIEEYTYEGTINLVHCSDWVLSSCVYARNNVISTISNPGRQDLCVQATLDNISDCNNSPTFTQYPTPFICANNLFCYNNGAIEIDGDSLSYELITPLNSTNGNTVTYLGSYSSNNPVGGSSTFDSTTGNFCVTPPNLITSILAIRVNEYRNGAKIGSIIRDIQINVLSCANSYVSLSGKNDSVTIDILDTNKYRSRINCPSPLDTIFFEINTLNNFPNNVEMTSNINISGANFTIDNNNTPNPKLIFEWIPTLADTINSPYFFTINIQDDNCPVPSNFSFQYEIIIGSSNISTKTETISPSCNGDNDGKISVLASGKSPPFNFEWNNGDTNNSISNLESNNYSLVITDSVGCSKLLNIFLPEPAQITSSDLITDVECNGDSTGSIDLTVSGGTKPYNYVWSNNVTVEDVDSLYAGTYKVLITDSNLCSHIDSFIITEPTSLNASLYSNIVSCNGYSDGEVTVLVSGGTSDYFIDIGGYQQQLINNNNLYTSPKIFQSGKYIVSITDFNGCLYTDSVEVLQPDSIQVNAINTDASCYLGSDGTSTLSITGGSSPYVEDWGIINPQNLSAGVYSYVITDSKGCLYNGSTTIYDPLPIQSLETVSDALCYGDSTGSVSLNITGGVGNYITNWFNKDPNKLVAGVYDYLVLDSNGCVFTDSVLISEPAQIIIYENIFNVNCYGDSSGSVILNSSGGTGLISFDWFGYDNTKLKAGVYNFRATDMNGCLFEDSITITEPDSLEINSTLYDISCKNLSDGIILITVDKGIPPYNYQWLGPNLFSSTAKDITNLFKGNYELTITDSNGCKKVKSYIINEPEGVTIDIKKSDYNGTNISCKNFSDGQINLQVFGQNSPYTFQWSNGSTSSSLSDLKTGSYECVITDINGCEYDTNIYLTEPNEALNVSIINNNLSNGYSLRCYGQSDGELIANTSGGTPDYSFYWSNGETLSSINNLSAGPYSVYITDLNGCFAYDSIMITEPDELLISFSITNDTCDREIGEIDLGLKGGVPPYKFIIDNDSVTYDYFLQLGSGNYNLKIIDDNKCNIDTFFSISNAVEKPVADFFINPQINNFYDQLDKPFLLADASKYYNDKIKNRTWILDGKTFSDSIFYYSFSDTGNYDISLIILTENNCIDSTSKKIIVHQFDIFVPNSFTPGNTDGINDSFFAKGYGIKEFSLKIYGRWGHLVFSSNNINERWNGKFLNNGQDCPIGNYVYKIDITSKYGEEKSKIGMLRLIR